MIQFKKILFLVIFVWGSCTLWAFEISNNNLVIPAVSINEPLQRTLPYRQETQLGTLVVEKANILGKSGKDRLSMLGNFSYTNPFLEKRISGSLSLISGIRYDAQHQTLHLSDITIQDIRLNDLGLSSYMTGEVRDMLAQMVHYIAQNKPIYNLKKLGEKARLIKTIAIEEGNVVVGMGI